MYGGGLCQSRKPCLARSSVLAAHLPSGVVVWLPNDDPYETAMSSNEFVRGDCRRPLRFGDGSIDHILCSHYFEQQVFPNEAATLLDEFKRSTQGRRWLHVALPDLPQMAKECIVAADAGQPNATDHLSRPRSCLGRIRQPAVSDARFGGRFGVSHRWMYDRHTISAKLVEHGFRLLARTLRRAPPFAKTIVDSSLHVVAARP
jgi:hypothetical protein